MPAVYSKPPLSIQEQISLLRKRGMSFADETGAREVLSHLNYYRLRWYWVTFEEASDSQDHAFKKNTRFEDVLSLYYFDEGLRDCLLYYLEKLEIYLRTKFAYCLATACEDPLAYRELTWFDRKDRADEIMWDHSEALAQLDEDFRESGEVFARKLRDKYEHPPIWAVVEVMTFGQLARWCKNLRHAWVMDTIGEFIGIKNKRQLKSFLHSASALRNICAHHSRLIYRDLGLLPARPNDGTLGRSWAKGSRRPYNLIIFLAHAMQHLDSSVHLGTALQELSEKHNVPLSALGFPADWASRPVWAAAA